MLPLPESAHRHWPFAATWQLPVGDPDRLGGPAGKGAPPFSCTRNVTPGGHEGADLSNRRGGDLVCAAACGVVVTTGNRGDGFGERVVIAHREPAGRVVYSVYAHLVTGSVRVRPRDMVAIGQPLGRVGMTGRATSPHLHFELRQPEQLDARWENAAVVDPLAWVETHAGAPDPDAPSPALRRWASGAGLLAPGDADSVMPRGEWWRALAAASDAGGDTLAADAEAAHATLAEAHVVGTAMTLAPDRAPRWREVSHDLAALRRTALRLPPAPPSMTGGGPSRVRDPRQLDRLDRGHAAPMTRLEAMRLLVGLAPHPAPPPKHRRHPRRASPVDSTATADSLAHSR